MTSHEVDSYLETQPIQTDDGLLEFGGYCETHKQAWEELWPETYLCEKCFSEYYYQSQDDYAGLSYNGDYQLQLFDL